MHGGVMQLYWEQQQETLDAMKEAAGRIWKTPIFHRIFSAMISFPFLLAEQATHATTAPAPRAPHSPARHNSRQWTGECALGGGAT